MNEISDEWPPPLNICTTVAVRITLEVYVLVAKILFRVLLPFLEPKYKLLPNEHHVLKLNMEELIVQENEK